MGCSTRCDDDVAGGESPRKRQRDRELWGEIGGGGGREGGGTPLVESPLIPGVGALALPSLIIVNGLVVTSPF